MTNPTNEHREQARAILRACEERTGMGLASDSLPNDLADRIEAALSSRDAEIREVLEGLACWPYENIPCWCSHSPDHDSKDPICLATRALYAKLQAKGVE